MELAVGALVLAAIAAVVVFLRLRAPRWSLTSWQADGFGRWVLQPVLVLDGETFRFETPDEYIAKLREVVRRHPSAVAHVTQLVWQLERVRPQFARASAPDAITVIERWQTPAQ